MIQYDVAARSDDARTREEARNWLLTYNRGDVEATLAIRDWLDHRSDTIMPIESIDGIFREHVSDPVSEGAMP